MKSHSLRQLLFGALAATALSCHAGDRYVTSVGKLACGDVKYTVKSPCMRSDDGGLNECKRQTLQIQGKQKARNVTLPDLTAEDAERYRKIGGELDSLYLVSWSCVSHLNQPILLLYYSIGGGSAPYSELYAKYDAQGNLLNNRAKQLPGNVYDAFDEHATPVHSIMPRN
jgi:hypothetical protein